MDNTWSVYKHTCPDGTVYIGITSNEPETRWANGFGYRNNSKFFRLIVKFGWDNISHEVLQTGLNADKAAQVEKNLIHEYGALSCNVMNNQASGSSAKSKPGFNEDDYTSDELNAINLWCTVIYRELSDELRMKIVEDHKGSWERTALEFASGDRTRAVKELIYIQKYGDNLRGVDSMAYSEEDIESIVKMFESTDNKIHS